MDAGNNAYSEQVEVPIWLDEIILGVTEGMRHSSAIRLVGRWYSKGLRRKEVFLLLHIWNEMNRPPLSEGEISLIYDTTKKWERPRKDYQMSDEEARAIVREVRKQMKAGKL